MFKTQKQVNHEEFTDAISLMRETLNRLKMSLVDSNEISDLVVNLINQQNDKGYYTLSSVDDMPADARFDYTYIPTCCASALMIELVNQSHDYSEDLLMLLDKSLVFIARRNFLGHGYGAYQGYLKCLEIFEKNSVDKFLGEHKKRYYRFSRLWSEIPNVLTSISKSDTNWFISEQDIEKANKYLETHKRSYYIAYGSNMDINQMKERCPDSKFIGAGELKNYQLNFRKSCSNYYATLDWKEGSSVPVVIWSISTDDEKKLDRFEGVAINCYYKRKIEIEVDGKLVEGLCYLIDENREEGKPPLNYINILKEAYIKFNFNENHLRYLINKDYF